MQWSCQDDSEHKDSTGNSKLDYRSNFDFEILQAFKRVVLFLVYYFVHNYSERKFRKGNDESGIGVFLILPCYFTYIKIYMAYSLIMTALGISTIILDLKYGAGAVLIDSGIIRLFRLFLCFFLLQGGAGRQDFRRALVLAITATLTLMVFLITSVIMIFNGERNASIVLITLEKLFSIGIYGIPLLVPRHLLYRRSAFKYFAIASVIDRIVSIFNSITAFYHMNDHLCVYLATNLITDGILIPIAILYSLHMDSKVSK